MKRTIAVTETVFMLPAALFFAALFLRNFLPLDNGSNGAQRVVLWYAGHRWTLWTLLIGLPLAALVAGSATLARNWVADASLRTDIARVTAALRAHPWVLLCGVMTAGAAISLALVALHMAAN